MSEETGGQSKTLVRGLSILNACSGSRSGLTLVEIADATELAPSTVHRLLAPWKPSHFCRSITKQVVGESVSPVSVWEMLLYVRAIMLRSCDH